MSTSTPELNSVIGALLFAAKEPLSARQISNILQKTAENYGEEAEPFKEIKTADVKKAVSELDEKMREGGIGIYISEIASGYRLQNDVHCGIWLREMMGRGKPNKLSKPALETLSVIAYRQPCTRSEIEAVRGVAVDAIVRTLLELELIKVVGRSELPGKPWLFGTTQQFLEHFGLKKLAELPGMEELKRVDQVLHQPAEGEGEEAEVEDDEDDEDGDSGMEEPPDEDDNAADDGEADAGEGDEADDDDNADEDDDDADAEEAAEEEDDSGSTQGIDIAETPAADKGE